MTTSFSVIGSPIEHSLSPVLHLAAYKHLGLSYQYEKHEVPSGSLADFASTSSFGGLSVTMPLKQEAFDFAISHDEDSQRTRVANTLVRSPEGWNAYNTDVFGIAQALSALHDISSVVVIGSGATAKSGVVALTKLAPDAKLSVVSRNSEAGEHLVSFAQQQGFSASTTHATAEILTTADLVMSLVPSGAYPDLWQEVAQSSRRAMGTLFDVAYNPWPSNAASSWGDSGVISGIEMLIWQAIKQIELFVPASGGPTEFDRSALYTVMKDAVSSK